MQAMPFRSIVPIPQRRGGRFDDALAKCRFDSTEIQASRGLTPSGSPCSIR